MSDKIEPALTPEEWTELTALPLTTAVEMAGTPEAIASIALFHCPAGPSWEDVDNIHRAVRFSQEAAEATCDAAPYGKACPDCQAAVDDFKARLERHAATLARLLPPRDG